MPFGISLHRKKEKSEKNTSQDKWFIIENIPLLRDRIPFKVMSEERAKQKGVSEYTLWNDIKMELGIPLNVTYMSKKSDKEIDIYIGSKSLEEAKRTVAQYQANIERGYGVKIDLDKVELKEEKKS